MEYIDRRVVSTIRGLCADMVEKAGSGHPGLPLGSAAMTYTLWQKVMNHTSDYKPEYSIFDNYTYVLGGDGCMMEGITSEAFSLSGTLKLNKLIVLYDSNNISIEGNIDIAFTEDIQMKMKSLGFNVYTVEDGDDLNELLRVMNLAKESIEKKLKQLLEKDVLKKKGRLLHMENR